MAEFLEKANWEVGSLFGVEPKCIPATALLTEVASHAGIRMTALPVALAARCNGRLVTLGPKAQEAWSDESQDLTFQGEFEDGWAAAGHLVALHRGSRRLYDPTAQQVARALEYPVGPQALRLESLDPADGYWQFSNAALTLRYYAVPDEEAWKPKFVRLAEEYRASGLAAEVMRRVKGTPSSKGQQASRDPW